MPLFKAIHQLIVPGVKKKDGSVVVPAGSTDVSLAHLAEEEVERLLKKGAIVLQEIEEAVTGKPTVTGPLVTDKDAPETSPAPVVTEEAPAADAKAGDDTESLV